MKLLIVTQKVDATDSNLGFFISWIKKFSEYAEVTVIANEVGPYELPDNVRVLSLGKERGASRLVRLFRYRKFLFQILPKVDGIFFHMCPEYVLAAKFLPKLFGKKSILWYTHKEVSLRLRVASWLVNKIFTASKESCRLNSKKVEVVGHGIDTNVFTNRQANKHTLHLVTVGRIAPVKDLRTIILGFQGILKRIPSAKLSVIGEPITAVDRAYQKELKAMAPDVHFGSFPYGTVFASDRGYTVFVHASRTGSLDKAVLEALAAELPVFTSSETFSEAIPGVRKFKADDPKDLAEKILDTFERGEIVYNEAGREWVRKNHSLDKLIPKILDFYKC
ncbi:MAG: glycosyltransferase family 4 protein [bacterium]|nr:glycosyltransferase family 4 protein [bacterium]